MADHVQKPRSRRNHQFVEIEVLEVDVPGVLLEGTTDELRESPAVDVVAHIYTLDDSPGGGSYSHWYYDYTDFQRFRFWRFYISLSCIRRRKRGISARSRLHEII